LYAITGQLEIKTSFFLTKLSYLCPDIKKGMDKLFEIIFLDEAFAFLRELDKKHYEKNIVQHP